MIFVFYELLNQNHIQQFLLLYYKTNVHRNAPVTSLLKNGSATEIALTVQVPGAE